MKTIIRDIAKLTGVSPGTVSNALNNRKGVSRETKEKILMTAERLNYSKAANKKETRAIRFIIFKKHGYVVSDTPFFSALIEGIERESRSNGFELLVSHVIGNEHGYEDIHEIVKQSQVAGVIILATEMDESDLKSFRGLNIPIVILDNNFNNGDFDQVLINNSRGAYQAVQYLIEKGHKEIGCLGSSKPLNNFNSRLEGCKKALVEAKLDIGKEYDIFLEPTLEGAYRDMKSVLEQKNVRLPTAYFAFNDILAVGAIRAMQEMGIKIPEQVSVIGFDDMPFCEICSPRLSTLRVDKQFIGKAAVRRLLQRISEQDEPNIKVEVNTVLIERESVRAI